MAVKTLKRYKLCRTVTYLEYVEVLDTSLAQARRVAMASKRVRTKETRWSQLSAVEVSKP
jgi:hypothetical protein